VVLTAALDVTRLGARAPLSTDFLRAAAPDYCTSQQQAEAPENWFEQALAYATRKLHGDVAALTPAGAGMGQVAGYTAADYLIQRASQERRYALVPARTWDAALSYIRDPADITRLAFTLVESGRLAEALSLYDGLVRRFGADTDPSVVRLVRWARINTTGVLNKLQRFEETLTWCGEIVERYGTDADPAVVVDVLSARLNRMEALGELQRTDEAISCFGEIVSICDGFDSGGAQGLEVRIRQDHVSALGMKSMILLRQEKFDEALAASDEVVERFGADQHLEVRSGDGTVPSGQSCSASPLRAMAGGDRCVQRNLGDVLKGSVPPRHRVERRVQQGPTSPATGAIRGRGARVWRHPTGIPQ
jgi:tetratricopeptide (TPR) repeat protein